MTKRVDSPSRNARKAKYGQMPSLIDQIAQLQALDTPALRRGMARRLPPFVPAVRNWPEIP